MALEGCAIGVTGNFDRQILTNAVQASQNRKVLVWVAVTLINPIIHWGTEMRGGCPPCSIVYYSIV